MQPKLILTNRITEHVMALKLIQVEYAKDKVRMGADMLVFMKAVNVGLKRTGLVLHQAILAPEQHQVAAAGNIAQVPHRDVNVLITKKWTQAEIV